MTESPGAAPDAAPGLSRVKGPPEIGFPEMVRAEKGCCRPTLPYL